jgi:hypothetical protein
MENTKQVKWICPNHCGSFRMLNRNIVLALCPNPKCESVMMIPEKSIKRRIRKRIESKPFICSECGSPAEHVLTIIQKNPDIDACYACLSGLKNQFVLNKEMIREMTDEDTIETAG